MCVFFPESAACPGDLTCHIPGSSVGVFVLHSPSLSHLGAMAVLWGSKWHTLHYSATIPSFFFFHSSKFIFQIFFFIWLRGSLLHAGSSVFMAQVGSLLPWTLSCSRSDLLWSWLNSLHWGAQSLSYLTTRESWAPFCHTNGFLKSLSSL